jgi:GxxExxY protein
MDADRGDPQTYAVIGAVMAVHSEMGCGFLEAVYQEALAIELAPRSIRWEREVPPTVRYRGEILACTYRADFVCYGEALVELKALSTLTTAEHAQVINYLKASGLTRGLLLNFDATRLEYKRFIHTQPPETKT